MIYLVDFEDSFSYNLLQLLESIGDTKIISFKDSASLLNLIKDRDVLVLGPGPGHVDEYIHIVSPLIDLVKSKLIFIMGVCLGHQLILSHLYKCQILNCRQPMHGQSVSLVPSKELNGMLKIDYSSRVQRYNSWFVCTNNLAKNFCIMDEYNELALFSDCKNILTMQFHPESVGTSFRDQYFQALHSFLRYSSQDECNHALRNIRQTNT